MSVCKTCMRALCFTQSGETEFSKLSPALTPRLSLDLYVRFSPDPDKNVNHLSDPEDITFDTHVSFPDV